MEDAEKMIRGRVPTTGVAPGVGAMEDGHALAVLLLVLAGRDLAGHALAGRPLHSTGALTVVKGLGHQKDHLASQPRRIERRWQSRPNAHATKETYC